MQTVKILIRRRVLRRLIWVYSFCINGLTLITLWTNSADDKLMMFFIVYFILFYLCIYLFIFILFFS